MPTPIKRIQTDSEFLNRVQDAILPVVNALISIPILDGRLVVVPVRLAGATYMVEHKLGRTPLGWFVVKQDAQADVWEDSTSPDKSKLLAIAVSTSTDVQLTLWVF